MEQKSKRRIMSSFLLVFHDVFKTSFLVAESLGRVVSEIKIKKNVVAFFYLSTTRHMHKYNIIRNNIVSTVGQ